MDLARILQTARTADLYDLLATAFNILVERGEELNFGPVGIDTRHVDITPDDDGAFIVAYYSEANAVEAAVERGDNPAGRLAEEYEKRARGGA
ncbi:hypothetical protein OHR68_09710 [Spirillospora sp. NBC_00431]